MEPVETCRGCLKQEGNMYNLFDEYESNLTLADLLTNFVKIQLNQEDGLPTTICENCTRILIEFYNFSIIFEESEANLQNALKSLEQQDNNANPEKEYNENDTIFHLRKENYLFRRIDNSCQSNKGGAYVQSITPGNTLEFPKENMPDHVTKSNEDRSDGDLHMVQKVKTNVAGLHTNQSKNIIQFNVKKENNYLLLDKPLKHIDNSFLNDNGLKLNLKSNIVVYDNTSVDKMNKNIKILSENEVKLEFVDDQSLEQSSIVSSSHENIEQTCMKINEISNDTFDLDKDYEEIYLRPSSSLSFDTDVISSTFFGQEEKSVNLLKSSKSCRLCLATFQTNDLLKLHIKTHKPFTCEICGKGFSKKSYLSDHSQAHSTAKQFECQYCNKKFQRRTVLAKHRKIHTHPKEIICEVCGQGFTDKGTLTTHMMLRHKKERKFQCMICNMTFPLKATLEKHIFRHQRQNTDKTFGCSVCNMKYYDKCSLKRHFDMKHGEEEKRLGCTHCGKLYSSKANLLRHITKVHS